MRFVPADRRLSITALLIICLHEPALAHGRDDCTIGTTRRPPIVNLRIDNDLLGGQDQGYSNGVQLSVVTPNLKDYADDPCLPSVANWVNRWLGALQMEDADQRDMIATLSHGIFTPADPSRSELVESDRPYAALLLFGLGYNARKGDLLRTTQLQFGIIGPAAAGEQVQNGVHKLVGADKFRGWGNQLDNEPVFRLVYEQMHRFSANGGKRGWGMDTVVHYGGSLGNLATYANAGTELRIGVNLPDDFGSTPLRPAGENTAPPREPATQYQPGAHMFVALDTRIVWRDITLDGNTFRDSHSVDKRHVVSHVGYGVALMVHRWKFAVARYHVTSEFEGQPESPVFGSIAVSRAF